MNKSKYHWEYVLRLLYIVSILWRRKDRNVSECAETHPKRLSAVLNRRQSTNAYSAFLMIFRFFLRRIDHINDCIRPLNNGLAVIQFSPDYFHFHLCTFKRKLWDSLHKYLFVLCCHWKRWESICFRPFPSWLHIKFLLFYLQLSILLSRLSWAILDSDVKIERIDCSWTHPLPEHLFKKQMFF